MEKCDGDEDGREGKKLFLNRKSCTRSHTSWKVFTSRNNGESKSSKNGKLGKASSPFSCPSRGEKVKLIMFWGHVWRDFLHVTDSKAMFDRDSRTLATFVRPMNCWRSTPDILYGGSWWWDPTLKAASRSVVARCTAFVSIGSSHEFLKHLWQFLALFAFTVWQQSELFFGSFCVSKTLNSVSFFSFLSSAAVMSFERHSGKCRINFKCNRELWRESMIWEYRVGLPRPSTLSCAFSNRKSSDATPNDSFSLICTFHNLFWFCADTKRRYCFLPSFSPDFLNRNSNRRFVSLRCLSPRLELSFFTLSMLFFCFFRSLYQAFANQIFN